MLLTYSIFTLLSVFINLTSVYATPFDKGDITKHVPLHKRETEKLQARLVCYHKQAYHVAIVIDRDEYGVSYRYHATQKGQTRTFKLDRDRREGGSYVDSLIPKLSANIPINGYVDTFEEVDELINDTDLLPSNGYDCWQYLKNALNAMRQRMADAVRDGLCL
ncbi:hypothetical protein BDP55DRAFT_637919 [Colletotrichum godetiae]|uniref:Cholera enterotoxin subunit A2 n=1 Tax=Colletotrichum godetiae TaxID=1209918 RepID=A0AAJ0A8E8_9PEZI|nr:uncharacterized protein BDP55DRAFT_637919 [Colletotrichum godetiae]KAK1658423.1 hypothetical protein BDP55DRAFT_637919 [Colletotrichum godetiae]